MVVLIFSIRNLAPLSGGSFGGALFSPAKVARIPLSSAGLAEERRAENQPGEHTEVLRASYARGTQAG